MNSFLELHTSSDYLNSNRNYYTGIWEYINVASDYIIPFQFTTEVNNTSDIIIYSVDTDGNETDVTSKFIGFSELITSWTLTGSASLSSTANVITSATINAGSYITTNTFSLAAGAAVKFYTDKSDFNLPSNGMIELYDDSTLIKSVPWVSFYGTFYFQATSASSNYKIRIVVGTGGGTITSATTHARTSTIHNNGTGYYWYDGGQLSQSGISDTIYTLKINDEGTIYYSDYLDACGVSDKTKIKLSSSYDYGYIKYVTGYSQWIYKDTEVRRSPEAEVEITAVQRNGVRIDQKIVSAIRYNVDIKVTETEYEALVHALGGTITITDPQGKTYSCTAVELSQPTWYRSNGICTLTFLDLNNINVWTRNNDDL